MPKAPKLRRPMTNDERAVARAISPERVCYPPATAAKSLARSLAYEAVESEPTITDGQARAMVSIAQHFRRQIPSPIVDLAALLEASYAEPSPEPAP